MEPTYLLRNESRAHVLIEVTVTFFVLDSCFVILRLWSRRIQRATLRHDDFLVIATLIVITGTCIASIYSVRRGGVGRHIQYVPGEQRIEWLKSTVIAAPALYVISASLPKLAVISVYLSIVTDRPSRVCCWAIGFILVAFPLVCVPVILGQCQPMEYLWDKKILGGHCMSQAYLFRYGSIPNIVTDVPLLVLPMPLVWKLHVSAKVKAGLFVTFLLGGIGLVTSILRFVAFFEPLVDGTWAAVSLTCWIIIEPSIYLMASCMLAFRPLLRHLIHESTLAGFLSRSWSRTKESSAGNESYEVNYQAGVTKLPSDDGESHNKISREIDIRIEYSTINNDSFDMQTLSK